MIMAFISPIAIILTKDSFVSDKPEEDAEVKPENAAASDASEDEAAAQNA